jgi:hypothetical protein
MHGNTMFVAIRKSDLEMQLSMIHERNWLYRKM